MGYNRYEGSTGRYVYVDCPEEPPTLPPPNRPERPRPARSRRVGAPAPFRMPALEEQDLLVLAVLWLMYRSGGGQEMLIALAAYLLL